MFLQQSVCSAMKYSIVFAALLSNVYSARILCYFYFPSISHQYVFGQIAKELSRRGHEVTFITPNPLNDPQLTNLTEIDVSVGYNVWKTHDLSGISTIHNDLLSIYYFLSDLNENIFNLELSTEGVKNLLKKPKGSYDLILAESQSPVPYGLMHKFDAPVIAVSSLNVFSDYHNLFGNPIHPILFPDIMADFNKPVAAFGDKIRSLYFTTLGCLMHRFVIYPMSDRIARKYFGSDMPYIRDVVKNASLLMVNVNPIFSDGRPNVPNVIEFFNVHNTRSEGMSRDLKQILDNAKEGVVYFSLGTNVRFDHVQGDVKKTIMEALGDLPYTVICKWESEKLEGQPKNVHLRKWLPQQAILAHPNVKAFVTQGGLQSAEEAIINAVPLVVIPFLGDQPLNAKILTSKGMAETISPKDLNRRILTESIMKVAQDEKYRNKAKELRDIFLDQPQSGIDKVIWWCEYVIRHKGAKHLRSPAADIPLWEYFMLDVLAVVLIALYLVYKITKVTIKILLELFKRSTASTTSKKKKKN
ncbi:UDP-glycosyltransferase UGT5-like isoform X3 [Coccinella septempunctata]|uniref:UDP-glycosyltransferase UGT5-like isoform X3 n=1 Tax=Coccinella septempunctata TaxID=41139 RepID=UPI001D068B31|nr:UDP-glycosyltransferase UGT5-like isoform X3 [Coccinella septempunctata]